MHGRSIRPSGNIVCAPLSVEFIGTVEKVSFLFVLQCKKRYYTFVWRVLPLKVKLSLGISQCIYIAKIEMN